ncbi:MAG: Hint domain-containing protein [Paracoccus sp. (in: a-proteobacteria)]|nr:Hint domain-containing protein [Paracoccus sp. (in: a-proteobacteria)]
MSVTVTAADFAAANGAANFSNTTVSVSPTGGETLEITTEVMANGRIGQATVSGGSSLIEIRGSNANVAGGTHIGSITYKFEDNTSDGTVDPPGAQQVGAEGVSFRIQNIYGGSNTARWMDQITITAYDYDGNPIPGAVSATSANTTYPSRAATVTTGSNGSVTITGALNTNNSVSYADIKINESGDYNVAYYVISYGNGGTGAASAPNIYIGPVTYTPTAIPCFLRGTLIETDRGPVAVEYLGPGDLVLTRDNGLQPIRWIGSSRLSASMLTDNLRPIRIAAGALAQDIPSADLLVSPQHRCLVRSRIAQKMFGTDEVLVAAKQLCQIDGIDIAHDLTEVEYFHFLFDQHEIVFSNGAETESLYTGPEALKALGRAARQEIFAIFPELADRDYNPVAARSLTSGRMGRKLAVRHAQNGKALIN